MVHELSDGRRPFKAIRREVIDEFERRYLEHVLERHAHDLSAVRQSSGLSIRHLRRLIRKHGLDAKVDGGAGPGGPPAGAPVELPPPPPRDAPAIHGAA